MKQALSQVKNYPKIKLFGYYCVATNLDETPGKVVSLNKYRWNIEYMFRTRKTNLNAHPLFVYTNEHIIGHLKIVCLKLNVLRLLHLDMYKVIGKTEDIEKLDDEDPDYE